MLRGFGSFISSLGALALLCGAFSDAIADTSQTKDDSININKEFKKVDQRISVERLKEVLAAIKKLS